MPRDLLVALAALAQTGVLANAAEFGSSDSTFYKTYSVGRNEVDTEVARVRSDERTKAQQRLRAAQHEAEDLRRKLDTMLEK